MGRDTVQLETVVNTISQEYLLEFTSEYGIPKTLHPELPGPEDRIIDFPEGKARQKREGVPNCYGLANECSQRRDAGREHLLHRSRESAGYTPYPHPKTTGNATVLSRNKSQILSRGRDMDLFNLIRAPNPTKVKIGSRSPAPHEVPLLTLTTNRVIEMDDPTAATDSSGVPYTIERSPLNFAHEAWASDQEPLPQKCRHPPTAAESRKRGRDGIDVNAPPRVLRRDHADPRPTGSAHGGKSLAAIQLGLASTHLVPVPDDAPVGVSDPDPLSFADPQPRHSADIAQSSQGTTAAGDPESENASSPLAVGSPEGIYRPEWGVVNGSLLDTPEACQDLVDYVAPPGYFSELRHLHNDEFLK
uniref:Uncharacterized protein n=1 Tax=Tanacetum cinerariifolium TaxID=118510 RepID=A0A699JJE6_TANCI|nr:hypothetical protein [Tanacetum cinerariifolium]